MKNKSLKIILLASALFMGQLSYSMASEAASAARTVVTRFGGQARAATGRAFLTAATVPTKSLNYYSKTTQNLVPMARMAYPAPVRNYSTTPSPAIKQIIAESVAQLMPAHEAEQIAAEALKNPNDIQGLEKAREKLSKALANYQSINNIIDLYKDKPVDKEPLEDRIAALSRAINLPKVSAKYPQAAHLTLQEAAQMLAKTKALPSYTDQEMEEKVLALRNLGDFFDATLSVNPKFSRSSKEYREFLKLMADAAKTFLNLDNYYFKGYFGRRVR